MSTQRRFYASILATVGLLLNFGLARAGPIFDQSKPSEQSRSVKKNILNEYASSSEHGETPDKEVRESLSDRELSYVIGNPKIVTKVGAGLPSFILRTAIGVGVAILIRNLLK